MEPDDVLEFPGHGALAQRIRVSLRKDREVNQGLPDVIVNLHKGTIKILHRATVAPWDGTEMKVSKLSEQDMRGIVDTKQHMGKYQKISDQIKALSPGEGLKVKFETERVAINTMQRINALKRKGEHGGDIIINRRRLNLYAYREK